MKNIRKFKILIGLFAMFSLFSLGRVNAMEKHNVENFNNQNNNRRVTIYLNEGINIVKNEKELNELKEFLKKNTFKDIEYSGYPQDLLRFYGKISDFINNLWSSLEKDMLDINYFENMELTKDDSAIIIKFRENGIKEYDPKKIYSKLEIDSEHYDNTLNLMKIIFSAYVEGRKFKHDEVISDEEAAMRICDSGEINEKRNKNYKIVNKNAEFSVSIKKYEDFNNLHQNLMEFRRLLEKINFKNINFSGDINDLYLFYSIISNDKSIKELCDEYDILDAEDVFSTIKLEEDYSKFIFKIDKGNEKILNKLESSSECDFNMFNLINQIVSYYVKLKKGKSNNKKVIGSKPQYATREELKNALRTAINEYKNLISKNPIKENYLYSNDYIFKDYSYKNDLNERFKDIFYYYIENYENFNLKNDSNEFLNNYGIKDFGSFSQSECNLFNDMIKFNNSKNLDDEVSTQEEHKFLFEINGVRCEKDKNEMLKYLNSLLKDESIKYEYEKFIKNIFENYLDSYANKYCTSLYNNKNVNEYESIFDLISGLKKLFLDILDIKIISNNDLNFLNLNFKKLNSNDNEYEKKINTVIDIIKSKNDSEEVWENMSEKGKLIYDFFLTAKSFIMKENFWNLFFGYLFFKQATIEKDFFHLDDELLYSEYKKDEKD